MSFGRTRDKRTLYAVDVTGGGRRGPPTHGYRLRGSRRRGRPLVQNLQGGFRACGIET